MITAIKDDLSEDTEEPKADSRDVTGAKTHAS